MYTFIYMEASNAPVYDVLLGYGVRIWCRFARYVYIHMYRWNNMTARLCVEHCCGNKRQGMFFCLSAVDVVNPSAVNLPVSWAPHHHSLNL